MKAYIIKEKAPEGASINCPDNVIELMKEESYLDREVFYIIILTTGNNVIKTVPCAVGGVNAAYVSPREIIRELVTTGAAAGFIMVHNHPSGDPEPSTEDMTVTKRFQAIGRLIGLPMQDHVIISRGGGLSLRERRTDIFNSLSSTEEQIELALD